MIKVSSLSLFFASAMFLVACGDSAGDADSGVQLKDQGTNNPDGGTNNPDGNVNNPDGNVNNPDGSTPAACNPVTDTNCGQGETCRLNLAAPAGPQCRMPIGGPVAYLASCAGAPDSCAPGLTCLDPGDGAICLKICDAGDDTDCANLGNDPNGYGCVGPLQAAPAYGLCLPNPPACVPWDDMCEATNYCEYTGGANDFGCIPEGTAVAGGACSPQNPCMKGSMCLNLGQGGTCMTPCNPTGGAGCGQDEVCFGIQDQNGQALPFGFCDDAPTTCTVLSDNCPAGEYCQAYQDGNFCSTEGTAQVGQPCSGANLCMRGAVCDGQNCRQVCDPAASPSTCPNAGMCQNAGEFGVCP